MTDTARRTYLGLGRGFLGVGLAVAAFALLDAALDLGFFRGSPLGTALFLALVGALLLWTVRQADAERARRAADDVVGDLDAASEADGAARGDGAGRRGPRG